MILNWRWLTPRCSYPRGTKDAAAAQLALAESHLERIPEGAAAAADGNRVTAVDAGARSGQFTEVVEQVNLLDASIAEANERSMAIGSELRGSRADESRDSRDVDRAAG